VSTTCLQEGYKCDITIALAESVYDELTTSFRNLSSEVVIDDRLHLSIGHRLYDARAAGYPHVVVLGRKVC